MSTSPWPEGCLGALSLTFDDGMPNQLEKAVPLLDEFGIRGTFYIPPRGNDWQDRLRAWVPAYEQGHEIGNHSLSHTCSRGFADNPQAKGLETCTLADIEADVLEAERRLNELFPYPTGTRSFCYPCFQSFVGCGLTRQSYVPVIARHFVAGRGLGEVPNHPATADLHYLWSWMIRGQHGTELVGMAEQCAARGRWGVITFHGVHQGHLSVADGDFRELLQHLQRSRHLWVAPVREVAAAVVAWRAAQGLAPE